MIIALFGSNCSPKVIFAKSEAHGILTDAHLEGTLKQTWVNSNSTSNLSIPIPFLPTTFYNE